MTPLSVILPCCVVLVISCQQKESGIQLRTTSLSAETSSSDSVATDTINIIKVTEVAAPAATPQSQITSILPTGTFHEDEVEEGVDGLPWLGLFTDDGGDFILKQTKIIATRVVDGLLDDEDKGEMTGWEINTESGEYPTILIYGGGLTEGKVEAAETPATLFPGDTSQFEFKGVNYSLYATGSNQFDSLSGMRYVTDYSLYIVRTDHGKSHTSLLVSHANFDDAMTSILWSGDLDRDGYIDFLIDMSRHYNVSQPTLFLSKPATQGEVVVPVADHSSVGC
jgi:hypothetical protein